MIRERENELFSKWKAEQKISNMFVLDGVVNENGWKNTPRRVLYLLNEVSDGEIRDVRNYFARYDIEEQYKNKHSKSVDSLALWQLGLNMLWEPNMWKDILSWDEIESIAKEPAARLSLLNQLAVIHLKKIPGEDAADFDRYWAIECNRMLIKEQLELYKPHYVVCCGTSWAIKKLYDNMEWDITDRGISYSIYKTVAYIGFWHPNIRAPKNVMFYSLQDAVRGIEELVFKNDDLED